MDAIVLLRDDHKTVEKLFKRFEKAEDGDLAERRSIADAVIEELTVHAWIEEQVFYPADERFKAKMSVLTENVRHHVEEEVKEWFPDVRKAMGRNRLTEIGDQLEAEKGRAPRDPLAVPSAASK
ncbi:MULTISPECIES: hemerythrin domain-containing protein [Streptomyces]|uniref:hemerythrin domain-containing protein n=1 Tax=Streptomyces TaxID=1883 RepID=UPI0004BD5FA5|nr:MULTISPECIES: hemerythrin domain-containing protein [Streptomyces]KJY18181.1 hemerythrin [Streptomyces sp. NRRL S-104]KOU83421.1 hemerythrin [Streptomyces sp. XY58]KOV05034.1 hemerythrin [Streptomyces sp. XY37]KOV46338.1 hemerythrin [Streptomyces sp. MMG1064]